MDECLENFWRSLRPFIKENLIFNETKDIEIMTMMALCQQSAAH